MVHAMRIYLAGINGRRDCAYASILGGRQWESGNIDCSTRGGQAINDYLHGRRNQRQPQTSLEQNGYPHGRGGTFEDSQKAALREFVNENIPCRRSAVEGGARQVIR